MMTQPNDTPPDTQAEGQPWEALVLDWLNVTADLLRESLPAAPDLEVADQWAIVIGDDKCGWTIVDCIDLHDCPSRSRQQVFAEIVQRTGAVALVYLFDGKGVWPEDPEGWAELQAYRTEKGCVEEHPMARRGVISLTWSAREIVNLAIPFHDEGLPGEKVETIRSHGTTPYNAIISTMPVLAKAEA